jgi:hypothetical protein
MLKLFSTSNLCPAYFFNAGKVKRDKAIRLVNTSNSVFSPNIAKYVTIKGIAGKERSITESKKAIYGLSLPFGENPATKAQD